jgi:hypothetical protein
MDLTVALSIGALFVGLQTYWISRSLSRVESAMARLTERVETHWVDAHVFDSHSSNLKP